METFAKNYFCPCSWVWTVPFLCFGLGLVVRLAVGKGLAYLACKKPRAQFPVPHKPGGGLAYLLIPALRRIKSSKLFLATLCVSSQPSIQKDFKKIGIPL